MSCSLSQKKTIDSLAREGDVIFSRKFGFPYTQLAVSVVDGVGHVSYVFKKNGTLYVADSRISLTNSHRKTLKEFLSNNFHFLKLWRPNSAPSNECLLRMSRIKFPYAAVKLSSGVRGHSCTSFVRSAYLDCNNGNYYNDYRDGVLPTSIIRDLPGSVVFECGVNDTVRPFLYTLGFILFLRFYLKR